MDSSLLTAIIGGIAGLITGAIGSLIAPWVHWGIEKKRYRRDRRAELVKQWREILLKEDFSRSDLLNHPLYGPLRELLKDEIKIILERPTNHLVVDLNSSTNSPDRDTIRREIARIEKLWDLI